MGLGVAIGGTAIGIGLVTIAARLPSLAPSLPRPPAECDHPKGQMAASDGLVVTISPTLATTQQAPRRIRRFPDQETVAFALLILLAIGFEIALGASFALSSASSSIQVLGWILLVAAVVSLAISVFTDSIDIRYEWYRGVAVGATGVALALLSGFASLPASEATRASQLVSIIVPASIVAIAHGAFAVRSRYGLKRAPGG